jgi:hypothetical protein
MEDQPRDPGALPPNKVAARLRYEHTLLSLERQATVLSELRIRTSFVLSATGIVASLLGPSALVRETPKSLVALALILVGTGLLCCIGVLWPVHDRGRLADPDLPRWRWQRGTRRWKLHPTIRELEKASVGEGEPEVLDRISKLLGHARRVNYRTLELRSWLFNAACILFTAQLAAWASILLHNRR